MNANNLWEKNHEKAGSSKQSWNSEQDPSSGPFSEVWACATHCYITWGSEYIVPGGSDLEVLVKMFIKVLNHTEEFPGCNKQHT